MSTVPAGIDPLAEIKESDAAIPARRTEEKVAVLQPAQPESFTN